jgi:FtsP/CotA-like multicopper oxidase with cupredoxin domain
VLAAGSYTVICTIPGHEGAGMTSTLMVAASAAGTAAGTPSASSHDYAAGTGPELVDYAAMDKAMGDSINKFLDPASKTKLTGNRPLAPIITADGTKVFTVTASIIDWETEAGKTVKAWAYNGQVPGPQIKVNLGDKVRLTLINHLPMGTDLHLHGVAVPFAMDGLAPLTQPLVATGQSFDYEFVAEKPAIGMYHAHNGGEMQVPNGLFGTFVIGDTALPTGRTIGGVAIPKDLRLAQDFPMVLNDAGVIGLTLNAKSFPSTDPIVVNSGDWFVTHYYNEGLQIHPMHLHGLDQLVIAKDGFPLDQPYWADTVLVSPGERYSVLVHADKPASTTWVWHCHILSHVESEAGAFGMFTAVVVK